MSTALAATGDSLRFRGEGASAGAPPSGSSAPSAEVRKEEWQGDLVKLGLFFAVCLAGLAALLVFLFWPMTPEQWSRVKFPLTLDDAKGLGDALREFCSMYYARVIVAHAAMYLFLQTFCIPGTVFVNLRECVKDEEQGREGGLTHSLTRGAFHTHATVGGALFGITTAYPLCLAYNTIGSILMYKLSQTFGVRACQNFFPERLDQFKTWVR